MVELSTHLCASCGETAFSYCPLLQNIFKLVSYNARRFFENGRSSLQVTLHLCTHSYSALPHNRQNYLIKLEGLNQMAFTNPHTDQISSWIAAGLIAVVFILVQRLRSQPNISNFPLFGKEYGSRRKRAEAFVRTPLEVYQKAYGVFKDQIYRLTTPDGKSALNSWFFDCMVANYH